MVSGVCGVSVSALTSSVISWDGWTIKATRAFKVLFTYKTLSDFFGS